MPPQTRRRVFSFKYGLVNFYPGTIFYKHDIHQLRTSSIVIVIKYHYRTQIHFFLRATYPALKGYNYPQAAVGMLVPNVVNIHNIGKFSIRVSIQQHGYHITPGFAVYGIVFNKMEVYDGGILFLAIEEGIIQDTQLTKFDGRNNFFIQS